MCNPYSQAELLRELSFQYITDAYQFHHQASVLLAGKELCNKCKYHIGYLRKIDVLLYMSVECSLKALLCVEYIDKPPEEVYWDVIRKKGHRIDRLLDSLSGLSSVLDDDTLESTIRGLANVEVSERYCFEVAAESQFHDGFSIDDTALDELVHGTQQLATIAERARDKTWHYRQNALKCHRTLAPAAVHEAMRQIQNGRTN